MMKRRGSSRLFTGSGIPAKRRKGLGLAWPSRSALSNYTAESCVLTVREDKEALSISLCLLPSLFKKHPAAERKLRREPSAHGEFWRLRMIAQPHISFTPSLLRLATM